MASKNNKKLKDQKEKHGGIINQALTLMPAEASQSTQNAFFLSALPLFAPLQSTRPSSARPLSESPQTIPPKVQPSRLHLSKLHPSNLTSFNLLLLSKIHWKMLNSKRA